jgi:glycosyltransferase involved in cell wall biosynthesis
MTAVRPRVGFLLERALGHAAHADNLRRLVPNEDSIEAFLVDIPWDVQGVAARIPVFNSNWTVRAGVRTRRRIRQLTRQQPLDALFIHTQVPAVLAPDWIGRIPTVVSVDATPLQYDTLGHGYRHRTGSQRVERAKWHANRACFHRAAHIVAWSAWAKQGLVDGYHVSADKVTVIPPGVTPSTWTTAATDLDGGREPVRILFVGGDLTRKGGDLLLQAFQHLRGEAASSPDQIDIELHLVTGTSVEAQPGVSLYRGLEPGSPALVDLYRQADIFCLPTRADCLPMVLSEAGAAGLAIISTDVAAIPEIVRDGETGLIVPADDIRALAQALRALVADRNLRQRLGRAAHELVCRGYNAEANTHRLAELLVGVANERGGVSR